MSNENQPFKPRVSPETWASIRTEREAGDSYAVLAKRHGLAVSSVHQHAKEERWIDPPRGKAKGKAKCKGIPKATSSAAVPNERHAERTNGDAEHSVKGGTGNTIPSAAIPKSRLVPWLPGQSGNPSGVPKSVHEARSRARGLTHEAIDRAVDMMRSPHPAVAAKGVETILKYGMGMPKDEPAEIRKAPPFDVRSLPPEDWDLADKMLAALEELQDRQKARLAAEAKAAAPEIIPPGGLSEPERLRAAEEDEGCR